MTFDASSFVRQIWSRDLAAFTVARDDAAAAESIRQRLGWLDAPFTMERHLPALQVLAAEAKGDGLDTIYLLGMGGSSLCAEVVRDVYGSRSTRLVVLDTTDERTIATVTKSLEPARSLFVVASKSGSTVEVASLERHFWSVMRAAIGSGAGRHFVAITDPNTALGTLALERGYRQIFANPADIGGRYSVLSLFGLVPTALVGHDVDAFLTSGRNMAERCRAQDSENPGVALGKFMGENAASGRDKLTIVAAPTLAPLGVWIEQLVAESTGKNGRGVLPVVDEPHAGRPTYAPDRAFVVIRTHPVDELGDFILALENAGHPVFQIETSPAALGAEFFRWEFATAVAGAVLGVNPFDEPNVRAAKARTEAQLEARRSTGSFRLHPPLSPRGDRLERSIGDTNRPSANEGSYVAILDYLPADPERRAAVDRVRVAIREKFGVASTHGVGPRYLHSTGQYHKGGPNTGVFVLLTADDSSSTLVPDTDYTFSVLKHAQALGDFDALAENGRRVIHVHCNADTDHARTMESVVELLG